MGKDLRQPDRHMVYPMSERTSSFSLEAAHTGLRMCVLSLQMGEKRNVTGLLNQFGGNTTQNDLVYIVCTNTLFYAWFSRS
ncbi:MAG TPA: hypothetical protein DCE42_16620 [Myxococcales bacterium]|nr:hypothetical protein [Deltaproteobacteria bacterium]HAA56391.1 hypothetical protein [Myxococcales bacterium]